MRSCDSEIMISNGSMPSSRTGTRSRSSSSPTPPLEAISEVEEARPAAPRSCSDTSSSSSTSSSEHSISFFSVNGSPIWTLGRFESSPSSRSCEASTEAPPMPSRPVSAPNSTTRLPAPAALARCSDSASSRPTHIAFTRQLES